MGASTELQFYSTIILTSTEGRQAAAWCNCEGFGADPFLSGVATAATINGIQSNGVIATFKHLCVDFNDSFVARFSFALVSPRISLDGVYAFTSHLTCLISTRISAFPVSCSSRCFLSSHDLPPFILYCRTPSLLLGLFSLLKFPL
jgi:hypothetical protein